MTPLSREGAWQALETHHREVAPLSMRSLFEHDPERFAKFSIQFEDMLVDWSKNRVTAETMRRLVDLAQAAGLKAWTERMFTGERINSTENRPVLHIALRNRSNRPILVDGVDAQDPIALPGGRSSRWSFTVVATRRLFAPTIGGSFDESRGWFQVQLPGQVSIRSRVQMESSAPLGDTPRT